MQKIQEWKIVEIFEDNDSIVPRYIQVPVMKPKPPVCYENTPCNDILNSVTYNKYCSTVSNIDTNYTYDWNNTSSASIAYSNYTTSARHWR